VKKRGTLGKTYGIKVWCNWEHLGEHIRNSKQKKKGEKENPKKSNLTLPLKEKALGLLHWVHIA
jgi:hypothetical protein